MMVTELGWLGASTVPMAKRTERKQEPGVAMVIAWIMPGTTPAALVTCCAWVRAFEIKSDRLQVDNCWEETWVPATENVRESPLLFCEMLLAKAPSALVVSWSLVMGAVN